MDYQKTHSELKHLLDAYHLWQVLPRCFGIEQQFANNMLKNMNNFADGCVVKSPDIYTKCDKKVIGIEHFEYDSSKKTRHGSAERLGIERANRKFLKITREAVVNGSDFFTEYNIETDSSVDALKENFLDSFRRHKRQINAYKANLSSMFGLDDMPVWFIAEDTSAMSPNFSNNLIIDGCLRIPLLPVFYRDVQEEILQSSIDGIIFISSFPIIHFVVFIANNQSGYEQLVKHFHFNENLPIEFYNDLSYGFGAFYVP